MGNNPFRARDVVLAERRYLACRERVRQAALAVGRSMVLLQAKADMDAARDDFLLALSRAIQSLSEE